MARDNRNRYGLHRRIPEPVKERVRRRCGFGCVICGLAIFQYEHFDPDFKDAREHRAEGITLLCANHNERRFRKQLSRETVAAANANPYCLRSGFASDWFDLESEQPHVVLGTVTFINVRDLITMGPENESLFSVKARDANGGPPRISARLFDLFGDEVLQIQDNEWRTTKSTCDIEVTGPSISIRDAWKREIVRIRAEVPNKLVFERLEMRIFGTTICVDERRLLLERAGRILHIEDVILKNAPSGIHLQTKGVN